MGNRLHHCGSRLRRPLGPAFAVVIFAVAGTSAPLSEVLAYREATEHDTTSVAAAAPAPAVPNAAARAPGRRRARAARARTARLRAPAASRKARRGPRVQITLEPGVTLVDVARTYQVPVARIIAANGIREPRSIHAGRKLVVPGATKVKALRPRPVCKSPAVEFLRVATDERARVVLTRCNGQADPSGLERLSHLARSLRTQNGATLELHPRLLQMLQKVASRFPGRRLEVISGYRPHPAGRDGVSNHTKGRAIDFRVAGVSNEVLRDYCRAEFEDAGVGYYPNSVFVHLDSRDRGAGKAFWVDYSRPGEAPRYGPLLPRHAADPDELAEILPPPRRTGRHGRRTRL